jgi:hypothetical protein
MMGIIFDAYLFFVNLAYQLQPIKYEKNYF